MFKKVVPLNSARHGNLKVRPVNAMTFAQNEYLVPLMVHEFNRAAATYPIVFVDAGEVLRPFALLGLQKGENLFIDGEGRWQANYVPAIVRRYPFSLGKDPNRQEFMICIDEQSAFVSEEEGEPLFDEGGNPTEMVERAKKYLSELHRFDQLTLQFSREMKDRELLAPINVQIKDEKGAVSQSISGCHGINEKKFNELPDEDFLNLRQRGILPAIYAHLLSLAQLERLMRLRERSA